MIKNSRYYFYIFLVVSSIVAFMAFALYQESIETNKKLKIQEAKVLSQFIKTFRDTYQEQFVDHGVSLNETTLHLLPASTIYQIADKLSKITQYKVQIRTVSDKSRNPKNMANAQERNFINYFRKHRDKKELIKEDDADYYYVRPLIIDYKCLKCHGKKEDAPPIIQQKYNSAYGYKLGDIRGVSVVHIKKSSLNQALNTKIRNIIVYSFLLWLVVLISIYTLLKKIDQLKKNYTKQLENEVQKKTDEVFYQANYDVLTGLVNRKLLFDRIEQGIKRSKRHKTSLVVFFIDLDNFKKINDSMGHSAGDKIIQKVANRLKGISRNEDTVARLGGDEFMVVTEMVYDKNIINNLAHRLIDIFNKKIDLDKHTIEISASIGISCYPHDADNVTDLMSYADIAMYKAKELGKNRFQYYDPKMSKMLLEKIEKEEDIIRGIENNEFEPFFQPQIDIAKGEVIGFETLARWNHPQKGLVYPNEFIQIAEELGVVTKIDTQIISKAMETFKRWKEKGLKIHKLSFNLSIQHFTNNSFISFIKSKIEELDFDPSWLEAEITETEMMADQQKAKKYLDELHKIGLSIAIDDFGTGYSSLAYLKRLPIDLLKIDRSFVRDIATDPNDVVIIKTIIDMSKNLNMEVIAEGVESKEQEIFLSQNGCHIVQGYMYSKPMPDNNLEEFIKNFKVT